MNNLKIGLVLTGGGAKSAYQAGVIDAISHLPIEIAAISAVGAGALNGSVVASTIHAADAARRLRMLWNETVLSEECSVRLGPLPVLRLGVYLTLLFGGGVTPEIEEKLRGAVSKSQRAYTAGRSSTRLPDADLVSTTLGLVAELINVSTDAELDQYLSGAFQQAAARPGRPFFVSVYETEGGLIEAAKHGLQLLGLLQAGAPRYIEVSAPSLPEEDRLAAVLASATLPFICRDVAIGASTYVDGSFGGFQRSPGAVPLQPLRLRGELDLDAIVVVQTESGVAWNANDFKGRPIIEIRPSKPGYSEGVHYFWPEKESLAKWIDLGEMDAAKVLGDYLRTVGDWENASATRNRLLDEAAGLED